jgi:hypothetical protein
MSDAMLPIGAGGTLASAMMRIQMRNCEAMAAATKASTESLGALARRQSEIMEATLRSAMAQASGTATADPATRIAVPFDTMKTMLLEGTAHANMLSQMAAQSSATVAGILQDRLLAALDETKAALLQAMPASSRA